MTEKPKTVAVPVELLDELRRWREGDSGRVGGQIADDFIALLPKPTPRLVAVDLSSGVVDAENDEITWNFGDLDARPDLLTLLDDMVDSLPNVMRVGLKSRIRAALGVTG